MDTQVFSMVENNYPRRHGDREVFTEVLVESCGLKFQGTRRCRANGSESRLAGDGSNWDLVYRTSVVGFSRSRLQTFSPLII
jgi:hypothetical protein